MSDEKYEETTPIQDINEITEEPSEETCEPSSKVTGVVHECLKLNIRKEPSKDSDVIEVVKFLETVEIDLDMSTDDWYAVCTSSGQKGFCMKEFISINR